MVQTAYAEGIRKAVAGMVVDMTDHDIVTRICATAAGIGFGLAVSDSTGRKDAVIGGALTSFLGITTRDITLAVRATPDKYAQYENMGVLRYGTIWVSPGATVARGDPVHYSTTTGVLTNTGGIGPVLGARWEEGGASGDLAAVHLPAFAQN